MAARVGWWAAVRAVGAGGPRFPWAPIVLNGVGAGLAASAMDHAGPEAQKLFAMAMIAILAAFGLALSWGNE